MYSDKTENSNPEKENFDKPNWKIVCEAILSYIKKYEISPLNKGGVNLNKSQILQFINSAKSSLISGDKIVKPATEKYIDQITEEVVILFEANKALAGALSQEYPINLDLIKTYLENYSPDRGSYPEENLRQNLKHIFDNDLLPKRAVYTTNDDPYKRIRNFVNNPDAKILGNDTWDKFILDNISKKIHDNLKSNSDYTLYQLGLKLKPIISLAKDYYKSDIKDIGKYEEALNKQLKELFDNCANDFGSIDAKFLEEFFANYKKNNSLTKNIAKALQELKEKSEDGKLTDKDVESYKKITDYLASPPEAKKPGEEDKETKKVNTTPKPADAGAITYYITDIFLKIDSKELYAKKDINKFIKEYLDSKKSEIGDQLKNRIDLRLKENMDQIYQINKEFVIPGEFFKEFFKNYKSDDGISFDNRLAKAVDELTKGRGNKIAAYSLFEMYITKKGVLHEDFRINICRYLFFKLSSALGKEDIKDIKSFINEAAQNAAQKNWAQEKDIEEFKKLLEDGIEKIFEASKKNGINITLIHQFFVEFNPNVDLNENLNRVLRSIEDEKYARELAEKNVDEYANERIKYFSSEISRKFNKRSLYSLSDVMSKVTNYLYSISPKLNEQLIKDIDARFCNEIREIFIYNNDAEANRIKGEFWAEFFRQYDPQILPEERLANVLDAMPKDKDGSISKNYIHLKHQFEKHLEARGSENSPSDKDPVKQMLQEIAKRFKEKGKYNVGEVCQIIDNYRISKENEDILFELRTELRQNITEIFKINETEKIKGLFFKNFFESYIPQNSLDSNIIGTLRKLPLTGYVEGQKFAANNPEGRISPEYAGLINYFYNNEINLQPDFKRFGNYTDGEARAAQEENERGGKLENKEAFTPDEEVFGKDILSARLLDAVNGIDPRNDVEEPLDPKEFLPLAKELIRDGASLTDVITDNNGVETTPFHALIEKQMPSEALTLFLYSKQGGRKINLEAYDNRRENIVEAILGEKNFTEGDKTKHAYSLLLLELIKTSPKILLNHDRIFEDTSLYEDIANYVNETGGIFEQALTELSKDFRPIQRTELARAFIKTIQIARENGEDATSIQSKINNLNAVLNGIQRFSEHGISKILAEFKHDSSGFNDPYIFFLIQSHKNNGKNIEMPTLIISSFLDSPLFYKNINTETLKLANIVINQRTRGKFILSELSDVEKPLKEGAYLDGYVYDIPDTEKYFRELVSNQSSLPNEVVVNAIKTYFDTRVPNTENYSIEKMILSIKTLQNLNPNVSSNIINKLNQFLQKQGKIKTLSDILVQHATNTQDKNLQEIIEFYRSAPSRFEIAEEFRKTSPEVQAIENDQNKTPAAKEREIAKIMQNTFSYEEAETGVHWWLKHKLSQIAEQNSNPEEFKSKVTEFLSKYKVSPLVNGNIYRLVKGEDFARFVPAFDEFISSKNDVQLESHIYINGHALIKAAVDTMLSSGGKDYPDSIEILIEKGCKPISSDVGSQGVLENLINRRLVESFKIILQNNNPRNALNKSEQLTVLEISLKAIVNDQFSDADGKYIEMVKFALEKYIEPGNKTGLLERVSEVKKLTAKYFNDLTNILPVDRVKDNIHAAQDKAKYINKISQEVGIYIKTLNLPEVQATELLKEFSGEKDFIRLAYVNNLKKIWELIKKTENNTLEANIHDNALKGATLDLLEAKNILKANGFAKVDDRDAQDYFDARAGKIEELKTKYASEFKSKGYQPTVPNTKTSDFNSGFLSTQDLNRIDEQVKYFTEQKTPKMALLSDSGKLGWFPFAMVFKGLLEKSETANAQERGWKSIGADGNHSLRLGTAMFLAEKKWVAETGVIKGGIVKQTGGVVEGIVGGRGWMGLSEKLSWYGEAFHGLMKFDIARGGILEGIELKKQNAGWAAQAWNGIGTLTYLGTIQRLGVSSGLSLSDPLIWLGGQALIKAGIIRPGQEKGSITGDIASYILPSDTRIDLQLADLGREKVQIPFAVKDRFISLGFSGWDWVKYKLSNPAIPSNILPGNPELAKNLSELDRQVVRAGEGVLKEIKDAKFNSKPIIITNKVNGEEISGVVVDLTNGHAIDARVEMSKIFADDTNLNIISAGLFGVNKKNNTKTAREKRNEFIKLANAAKRYNLESDATSYIAEAFAEKVGLLNLSQMNGIDILDIRKGNDTDSSIIKIVIHRDNASHIMIDKDHPLAVEMEFEVPNPDNQIHMITLTNSSRGPSEPAREFLNNITSRLNEKLKNHNLPGDLKFVDLGVSYDESIKSYRKEGYFVKPTALIPIGKANSNDVKGKYLTPEIYRELISQNSAVEGIYEYSKWNKRTQKWLDDEKSQMIGIVNLEVGSWKSKNNNTKIELSKYLKYNNTFEELSGFPAENKLGVIINANDELYWPASRFNIVGLPDSAKVTIGNEIINKDQFGIVVKIENGGKIEKLHLYGHSNYSLEDVATNIERNNNVKAKIDISSWAIKEQEEFLLERKQREAAYKSYKKFVTQYNKLTEHYNTFEAGSIAESDKIAVDIIGKTADASLDDATAREIEATMARVKTLQTQEVKEIEDIKEELNKLKNKQQTILPKNRSCDDIRDYTTKLIDDQLKKLDEFTAKLTEGYNKRNTALESMLKEGKRGMGVYATIVETNRIISETNTPDEVVKYLNNYSDIAGIENNLKAMAIVKSDLGELLYLSAPLKPNQEDEFEKFLAEERYQELLEKYDIKLPMDVGKVVKTALEKANKEIENLKKQKDAIKLEIEEFLAGEEYKKLTENYNNLVSELKKLQEQPQLNKEDIEKQQQKILAEQEILAEEKSRLLAEQQALLVNKYEVEKMINETDQENLTAPAMINLGGLAGSLTNIEYLLRYNQDALQEITANITKGNEEIQNSQEELEKRIIKINDEDGEKGDHIIYLNREYKIVRHTEFKGKEAIETTYEQSTNGEVIETKTITKEEKTTTKTQKLDALPTLQIKPEETKEEYQPYQPQQDGQLPIISPKTQDIKIERVNGGKIIFDNLKIDKARDLLIGFMPINIDLPANTNNEESINIANLGKPLIFDAKNAENINITDLGKNLAQQETSPVIKYSVPEDKGNIRANIIAAYENFGNYLKASGKNISEIDKILKAKSGAFILYCENLEHYTKSSDSSIFNDLSDTGVFLYPDENSVGTKTDTDQFCYNTNFYINQAARTAREIPIPSNIVYNNEQQKGTPKSMEEELNLIRDSICQIEPKQKNSKHR